MTTNQKKTESNFLAFLKNSLIFRCFCVNAIALLISSALFFGLNLEYYFCAVVFSLAIAFVVLYTKGCLYAVVSALILSICLDVFFIEPVLTITISLYAMLVVPLSLIILAVMLSYVKKLIIKKEKETSKLENLKFREDVLAAVSHDIFTSLQTIVSASLAISELKVTEESRKIELLNEINKQGQWIADACENIILNEKIKSLKEKYYLKSEYVYEVIDSAVSKFLSRGYPIKVKKIVQDVRLSCMMEARLIEQVIINLLVNAALHSKTATCVIVSAEAVGDGVEFNVFDNGEGFKEKDLTNLFYGSYKYFTMGDMCGKRNIGVGLATCKSIIDLHGGTIVASNLKDNGANIKFTIPTLNKEEIETV